MIEYKDTGILHRPETFDGWIVNETRCYFPLGLTDQDTVLDIGGHIGAFASRAKMECSGVKLVSIEAEESNYEVLARNAQKFGFDALRGAVVDDAQHGQPITLYVNVAKNNATHSTTPIKGRITQVIDGIGFKRLLEEVVPTVVKCDIEGGEYAFDWRVLESMPSVKSVVMELHLQKKGSREQARDLIQLMSDIGFSVARQPVVGDKNWTTLGSWTRE